MNFMTIREASALWNIDSSRIGKLLKEGKIVGAEKQGGHWYIPKDAPRPMDGRTRGAKKGAEPKQFRFPLLVNRDEGQFNPPLTDDEILLRRAQIDFFAGDFASAAAKFDYLEARAESIYIRISVLFFKCVLTVAYKKGVGFQNMMYNLNLELAREFPYKREMELFLPWLYTYMGLYIAAAECLTVEPDYDYHPSVYPLLYYLTFFHEIQENIAIPNPDTHVIICRQMERDGNCLEAQELNAVLFFMYSSMSNEKAALYHLRRGLNIARDHNLMVVAACYESYFPDAYKAVLREYPKDFSERVLQCSSQIRDSFACFASSCDITDMYTILSKEDYRYILYAVQGYKYKEIANHLDISERTVATKYSRIFEKLGVNNRQELIRLYRDTTR